MEIEAHHHHIRFYRAPDGLIFAAVLDVAEMAVAIANSLVAADRPDEAEAIVSFVRPLVDSIDDVGLDPHRN